MNEFNTVNFERILPHLTPTRRAILTAAHDPEGPSVALRDEVIASLPEGADEEGFENESEILGAWGLTADAGGVASTDEHGNMTNRERVMLSHRGDELMDEHGDELAERYVPRDDRTADDWLSYPVPLEHKFIELVDEVADLRAQVEQNEAAD